MFPFKSHIILALAFSSIVYFELIFLCSVTKASNFILLQVDIQFCQHHLSKRLFWPH